MKTNEELARDCGIAHANRVHPNVTEFATSKESIDRFASLVEQRLIAKLTEGVWEPVAEQFQTLDKSDWHNFIDEAHRVNTKADGRWLVRQLYTTEQLASAVLAERIKERNALAEVCEAMGAPEIAKYLREQAAIRGATT